MRYFRSTPARTDFSELPRCMKRQQHCTFTSTPPLRPSSPWSNSTASSRPDNKPTHPYLFSNLIKNAELQPRNIMGRGCWSKHAMGSDQTRNLMNGITWQNEIVNLFELQSHISTSDSYIILTCNAMSAMIISDYCWHDHPYPKPRGLVRLNQHWKKTIWWTWSAIRIRPFRKIQNIQRCSSVDIFRSCAGVTRVSHEPVRRWKKLQTKWAPQLLLQIIPRATHMKTYADSSN